MRTLLLLLPLAVLSAQTPKMSSSKMAAKAPAAKAPALKQDYKVSGNPNAPITVEAYTDYECPHCARFYEEFMPQFTKDYIQTGKVKFIHRDFPLPMHPHAVMAAKYADAAGELGYYDVAVQQIFKTQDTWSVNGKNTGDIDAVLTQVIPPGAMQKIREIVKTTSPIDAEIAKDVSDAENRDHVPSTPTIVVVTKSGKREPISSILEMPYSIFRKYLDGKIAGQ
ncbi:MAG TPA: thioredoxin domain-containing protein [Bryobacteraceae bacterium]|nr:thioredoxin domain-containing protein [Bryobacteraceae bacterium]